MIWDYGFRRKQIIPNKPPFNEELQSVQLNVSQNVLTCNKHQLDFFFPEILCQCPINLSWRRDSFNSKLPSNSMSGLLPPALVRPLTSHAVWPVIYVYDHLVGPGCHGQQDGNLLINTLCTAFTSQPGFIQTKIMKQYDCLRFISFLQ